MTKDQSSGDHISGMVTGPVQGQIAVGKGIAQDQTIGSVKMELSEAEIVHLQHLFAKLKGDVAAAVPTSERDAALERIDELQEAIVIGQVDLTTVQYVKEWFARKLPKVAGIVASVLLDPLVGSIVGAAGGRIADEIVGPSGS